MHMLASSTDRWVAALDVHMELLQALLEMVAIAMYSLATPRGMQGAIAMVYAASRSITHIMVLPSIQA